MATTYWKIVQYLISKGKTETEARNLFDSGKVALVKYFDEDVKVENWDVTGITEPTTSELDTVDTEATKTYNNNRIRKTRKKAYGDIGEQLDLLYKDIVADKLDTTGEWAKKIKAIKDANAKE